MLASVLKRRAGMSIDKSVPALQGQLSARSGMRHTLKE